MSKLDELMALADAFWEHGTNEAIAHAEGSGYDGEKVNAARAALQDALKAVVEDAERYRWAHDHATASTEYHAKLKGHGYETVTCWHVRTVHGASDTDLGAAIDAARRP